MTTDLLSKLNPAQRAAVEHIEGPVLVIAGPGTGKTQVLATRIAYILQQTDTAPHNILCLTFTEAGVLAMRKRLQQMIGSAAYQVQIHTFHSFCNLIIQTYPDKFPQFSSSPTQLTELQRLKIWQELLENLPSDTRWQLRPTNNAVQFMSDIISAVQYLKREAITPADLQMAATSEVQQLNDNPKLNRKGEPTVEWQRNLRSAERNLELAELYKQYQEYIAENNFYDYEDMILMVVQQLTKEPDLSLEILERYLYVLVDEYQDTNGAQNKIIQLLGTATDTPNIFAVGDDDQAIYRFQGANVENMLFFKQQFPTARLITLTQNYRSTQVILDAAQSTISHNQARLNNYYPEVNKVLTASYQTGGEPVKLIEANNNVAELDFITEYIQKLHHDGVNYSRIAVLYRKHADADELAAACAQKEIPICQPAKIDALTNIRAKQLWQLLQLVEYSDHRREQIFAQIVLADFAQTQFKYSNLEVFKLLRAHQDLKEYGNPTLPLRTVFDLLVEQPDLAPQINNLAQEIMEWKTFAGNNPLTDLLIKVMQESGLGEKVFEKDQDPQAILCVNAVYDFVKQQVAQNIDYSLADLLHDVAIMQEHGIAIVATYLQDQTSDAVQFLTAHSSKGLEFEHVIIYKVVDGNWGGRRSRNLFKWPANLSILEEAETGVPNVEADPDEDERRLFYVAMTRAQRSLLVSYAQAYQDTNGVKETTASQFVNEIDTATYDKYTPSVKQQPESALITRWQQSTWELDNTPAMQDYIRSLVSDFKLSASALNEYLECPRKFLFNRLLKVPQAPSAAVALGNAMHKALELQARQAIAGKEVGLDYLVTMFDLALERELLPRKTYADVQTEARELLATYVEQQGFRLAAPAAVEYNFQSHPVMLELPDQEPICLGGKVDRLEWIDQANLRVRLVDFKTSSYKTEGQIRGETKDSNKNIWRQLVFYKMLGQLDPNFKPTNKINKYQIEQIEVVFLKPSDNKIKTVALEITEEDIETVKQEIADAVRRIRNLEFEGNEEHPLCGECEWCSM
jgi:DNA helicase-2/ATP-dependent DNA helicase PcrA